MKLDPELKNDVKVSKMRSEAAAVTDGDNGCDEDDEGGAVVWMHLGSESSIGRFMLPALLPGVEGIQPAGDARPLLLSDGPL